MTRGRIWVTFDNAAINRNVRAGDFFIGDGERLQLAVGQSLVMESFAVGDAGPACFTWEPALQRRISPDWRAGIVQPLRDLRMALVLHVDATGRFVHRVYTFCARFVRGLASGMAA